MVEPVKDVAASTISDEGTYATPVVLRCAPKNMRTYMMTTTVPLKGTDSVCVQLRVGGSSAPYLSITASSLSLARMPNDAVLRP